MIIIRHDQITSFVKATPNRRQLSPKVKLCIHTTFQQSIIPIFPIHQLIVRLTPPDFSHLTPSSPSIFLFGSSLRYLERRVRQIGRTFIRKAAINTGLEGKGEEWKGMDGREKGIKIDRLWAVQIFGKQRAFGLKEIKDKERPDVVWTAELCWVQSGECIWLNIWAQTKTGTGQHCKITFTRKKYRFTFRLFKDFRGNLYLSCLSAFTLQKLSLTVVTVWSLCALHWHRILTSKGTNESPP